jgi:alkylation response protein AidB-like acyl-CoA dehydrogenase
MQMDPRLERIADKNEAELIRDAVAKWFTRRSAADWRSFAQELGILGVGIPEISGGLGGGIAEQCAVADPIGEHLCALPYIERAIIVGTLLGESQTKAAQSVLEGVLQGVICPALVPGAVTSWHSHRTTIATASLSGDEFVINVGESLVCNTDGITHLLVAAGQPTRAGRALFFVAANSPGVTRIDTELLDGSSASWITLNRLAAKSETMIVDFGAADSLIERALDRAAIATCAESLGVLRSLAAHAKDYARQRQQFGQPLSKLSQIRDRIAEMTVGLYEAEAIFAAAVDAYAADSVQRSRLASAAKAYISAINRTVGEHAIQIHGAIGMTAEAPVGKYFRRALVLRASYGTPDQHLRRCGGADIASIDLGRLGHSAQSIYADVSAWARMSCPTAISDRLKRWPTDVLPAADHRLIQRLLCTQGWGAPHWPVEYGGRAWDSSCLYAFRRALTENGCPTRPPGEALNQLGPILIHHGTPDQRDRYLPGIVDGSTLWCQGFSESGAGSDLASLRCRAERVGDEYVINGSKLWTSWAHVADRMFGLFRTATSDRRQDGITFLLVDMRAPGINVRPIELIDGLPAGAHEVNEVFFDNVRVPLSDRVGTEGGGWALAKLTLGYERAFNFFGPALEAQLRALELLLRARPANDPDAKLHEHPLKGLAVDVRAFCEAELRIVAECVGGAIVPPELAAHAMLQGATLDQRAQRLAYELAGDAAILGYRPAELGGESDARNCNARMLAGVRYLSGRKETIYGGSSDIQRSIIARHVLQQ